MTRLVVVFSLYLIIVPVSASDSQIEIGSQNFFWNEIDAGTEILSENGQRTLLTYQIGNTNGAIRRTTRASIYLGDVNYDGMLNGAPYTTISGYTGFAVEKGWQLRLIDTSVQIYTDLSLGLDIWNRELDKGGNFGYTETYGLLFSRWGYGIHYYGWYAKTGLSFPWFVHEHVNLGLDLLPVPRPSAYTEFGFQDENFGLVFYTEGYRFAESPPAPFNGNNYVQPASNMSIAGVRIIYRF
ncbi:MAG: hypothetical protein OEX12_15145 [Gammaproteobacteria bacterium]|nr:hypothetical protein [Gammaproteobacteria bacterium]